MRNLFQCVLVLTAAGGCERTAPPPAASSSGPAPTPAARLTIEPVRNAELFSSLLDVDALIFNYTGGLVDCWLEETIGDKPTRRVMDTSELMRETQTNAKASGSNSGFIVLTRRTLDEKEIWSMKLVVGDTAQEKLGVKLTAATVGLGLKSKDGIIIQSFAAIKQPQEVDGPTVLMTAAGETPDGRAVVQLKCAPMKAAAK